MRIAIQQSFESFLFPFTEHLLAGLNDGDYLVHDFDGKLNLAVGAYAGLDKVLYAGQGSADVLKAFGNPTVKLSASVKPEVKLAASMDFKMAYEARFQAMLNKVGKAVRLHLFKSSTLSQNVTAAAGLTVSLNATADVKEMVTRHLPEVTSTLVNAAGGANSIGGNAVATLMGAVPSGELQKYIDEATDKLTSWLNKANGQKCNLQVALESTRSNTLLLACTFDLDAGDIVPAWQSAIKGDLFAALNTRAVTLDAGSGLEKDYQSKISFQCNVFNLWHFATWDEFHSNTTMVYAGNNVFHMQAKIERTTETTYVGALRDIDIYFSASADANAAGAISNSDLSLNIVMNAAGRDSINGIAKMLGAVDRSAQGNALVRDMRVFASNSRQGSAQLLFKIPGSSFAQFHADAHYGPEDEANWAVFAEAANELDAWHLADIGNVNATYRFDTYDAWGILNMVMSGAAHPDRTQIGTQGNWPDDWDELTDSAERTRIKYAMLAGQEYMNFCAALEELARIEADADVDTPWTSLLDLITKAIKNYLNVDFLRPAALATVRQCMGSYVLTGPAPATIPTDHFSVSIDLL